MNLESTKSAKAYLLEIVSKHQASNQVAAAFVEKYGDKIPDGLGCINCDLGTVTFSVFLQYKWIGDGSKEKALAAMGDAFGRDGWESEMDSSREHFNWFKTVDGVGLRIQGAEEMPPLPKSTPVAPSRFPLQIADAA